MHDVFVVLFMFIAIWMTSVNVSRAVHKRDVPGANFVYMSIGWTGLIYLLWLS